MLILISIAVPLIVDIALRFDKNRPKGAHPCTSSWGPSSSGQGGGKRVLEDFFKKSDHTVACSLGANGEKV